jgi:hypothetical protein
VWNSVLKAKFCWNTSEHHAEAGWRRGTREHLLLWTQDLAKDSQPFHEVLHPPSSCRNRSQQGQNSTESPEQLPSQNRDCNWRLVKSSERNNTFEVSQPLGTHSWIQPGPQRPASGGELVLLLAELLFLSCIPLLSYWPTCKEYWSRMSPLWSPHWVWYNTSRNESRVWHYTWGQLPCDVSSRACD